MFHASSASRTFRAAVSRVNGGNGGRSMVGSLVAGGMAAARITAGNRCGIKPPGAALQPGSQPLSRPRSEEHTSELQSLMRISYAVFCLKKKNTHQTTQK